MQPADIRVADNVSVYGRVFRIVDADAFTRAYFTAQGITLAPAEAVPMDPFRQLQAAKAQEQSKGEVPCPSPDGHAALALSPSPAFEHAIPERNSGCMRGASARWARGVTRKVEIKLRCGYCDAEGKQHSQGTAPSGFTQLGRLQAYLLNSKKVFIFLCTPLKRLSSWLCMPVRLPADLSHAPPCLDTVPIGSARIPSRPMEDLLVQSLVNYEGKTLWMHLQP